ncbi:MAG: AroB-related putative sugar phosphate phospholyase (cyclizing) [Chlorobium sp.]
MSDLIIRSALKEYAVHFVNDFTLPLKQLTDDGAFVICDRMVFDLYHDRLRKAVVEERCLVIEASETTKTLEKCKEIIEILVERKVRRNQKLIAIGGGVIQDVTAFIASILYRGVGWIFFPTTLLAQGDSCIGSKTSINLGHKKNLLGNFYPPDQIFIDPLFLQSLAVEDIKSGIGEILHFYYYSNSPLIGKLVSNYDNLIAHRELLKEYTQESLAIKKSVIEVDEFDKGERNKFNYGHTFGHAIETITNYGIRHGQAVTVGMDLANYLSCQTGLLSRELFDRMREQLSENFPDYDFSLCDIDSYFDALSSDKKNIGSTLGCILSEGPGALVRRQIPFADSLKGLIRSYFQHYPFSEVGENNS